MHQFTTLQEEKDGCTKFLTFVGRWSALDFLLMLYLPLLDICGWKPLNYILTLDCLGLISKS